MNKWFITWDRPEYKEWATRIDEGYLLLIIRKEKDNYLCVKAKLIMGETGLPNVELLEEKRLLVHDEAIKQIKVWK